MKWYLTIGCLEAACSPRRPQTIRWPSFHHPIVWEFSFCLQAKRVRNNIIFSCWESILKFHRRKVSFFPEVLNFDERWKSIIKYLVWLKSATFQWSSLVASLESEFYLDAILTSMDYWSTMDVVTEVTPPPMSVTWWIIHRPDLGSVCLDLRHGCSDTATRNPPMNCSAKRSSGAQCSMSAVGWKDDTIRAHWKRRAQLDNSDAICEPPTMWITGPNWQDFELNFPSILFEF
jgi:hypothetical protein